MMFKSHEVSVSPLMLVLSLVCLAGDAQDGSDLAALDGPGSGATVVINELLASNSGKTYVDPQGEAEDWIELYNLGATSLDVGGMYLTDDLQTPMKWQIPTGRPALTTLAARGYLVIWADKDVADPGLHAGFSLSDEGEDEFANVDLRTSQNYSWSFEGNQNPRDAFVREVFSGDTQRDMNQPYTRSRYYHLYLNGQYWGLFQTQERSEADYAQSYFRGDKEDYDVIKSRGGGGDGYDIEAADGNMAAWQRLWEAAAAGFDKDENYYRVLGLKSEIRRSGWRPQAAGCRRNHQWRIINNQSQGPPARPDFGLSHITYRFNPLPLPFPRRSAPKRASLSPECPAISRPIRLS